MTNTQTNDDIVFTGIGMITSHGCGFESNLAALDMQPVRTSATEYAVRGFNPLPHLTDKKVVKVVSRRDVLGLVAFENCQKNAGIKPGTFNPERTGLYVGAPPSACEDSDNYCESIERASNTYGELDDAEFGHTFRNASPTTLLVGLPNNVLCYGSKSLDARGPNSNYTALEMSGHMAIMGGARAIHLGRLDCAIVGGYSGHSDRIFTNALNHRGMMKPEPFDHNRQDGTMIAEGAAFLAMEKRSAAEARGARILATYVAGALASDGLGPDNMCYDDCGLRDALDRVMTRAGVAKDAVGVVMMTGAGLSSLDNLESETVKDFFGDSSHKPALVSTTTVWGNLMEAGGIAEVGVLADAYHRTQHREYLAQSGGNIDPSRPYALILRTSPWGEYSCILVRCEVSQSDIHKGESI